MKIVSDFKDYYDRHFPPEEGEGVYLRKTLPLEDPAVLRSILSADYGLHAPEPKEGIEVTYFAVLFCGKGVPVVRVTELKKRPVWTVDGWSERTEEEHSYHHDLDSLEADPRLNEIWRRRRPELRNAWDELVRRDWTPLHHALAAPVVVQARTRKYRGWYKSESRTHVDARLADLEFGKVFPADQAYQELAMFVDGVLPRTGGSVVEVSDDARYASRGFDPKWSFRNPDPPRRKRKRR